MDKKVVDGLMDLCDQNEKDFRILKENFGFPLIITTILSILYSISKNSITSVS